MYFGATHGVSYSSQERLANETGLDRADVGKILRAMAAAGLIQVVSDAVLTNALKQDGEARRDKRLVGYRRVIDANVALSDELAETVVVGKPIDPATRIRITKGNEGSSAEYLRSKRGDHVPLKPNGGNEGDVALSPTLGTGPAADHNSSDLEGNVIRDVEGNVSPPRVTINSVETGATSARILPSEVVARSNEEIIEPGNLDHASAPDGATPFADRLLAIYPFVVPNGDAWRKELDRSASILGEESVLDNATRLPAPSIRNSRKSLLPWLGMGLELHEARRLAKAVWGMGYPDDLLKKLIGAGEGKRLASLLQSLAYATESGREDPPPKAADWLIDLLQRENEHAT